MARRDPHGNELPRRMFYSGRTYYRVTAEGKKRAWTPLGHDYAVAIRRWASLEGGGLRVETLSDVIDAYRLDDGDMGYLRLTPTSTAVP